MKNKARLFLPLASLFSLLGVSACGGTVVPASSSKTATSASSSTPTSQTSTTSAESASSAISTSVDPNQTKVVFWHNMGHTNQELLGKMITAFEKLYPNITIEATSAASSYDDLESLILKSFQANTTPTMAFCYPDHVAEYLAKNEVADLTAYTTDSEIGFKESEGSHKDASGNTLYGADDYVKTFWEEGTSYATEGIYSVPFAKSTEALFYNKDIFAMNGWSVPTTWNEMWDLCRTIRAQETDKADGKYVKYPLGYDSDANMYITLSQQKAIPFTSATGDHYLFNNDQAKAMVNELKGYYDEGLFVTKGTSSNQSYTSTKFINQEIYMSIGSTGGTQYNDTDAFQVGVAVPPSMDLDKPAVISQGPSICFFKSASEAQRKAAWLFYKFITTADNSTFYSVSTGYQPVRVSSYQTDIYQKFINATGDTRGLFNDVATVATTMQNSYFNSPVFVGSANARNEVSGLLSSVLLGTKTVDKAFSDAMANCLLG